MRYLCMKSDLQLGVTSPLSIANTEPLEHAEPIKRRVPSHMALGLKNSHCLQASGSLGAVLEQGYAAARAAVRNANGLRTMLSLVQSRPSTSSVQPAVLTKLRALAAQALLGLAQDPNICHTLTKLQVLGVSSCRCLSVARCRF